MNCFVCTPTYNLIFNRRGYELYLFSVPTPTIGYSSRVLCTYHRVGGSACFSDVKGKVLHIRQRYIFVSFVLYLFCPLLSLIRSAVLTTIKMPIVTTPLSVEFHLVISYCYI